MAQPTETFTTSTTPARLKHRFRLNDFIFIAVFVGLVIVLGVTLFHQVSVKRQVLAATKVTDAVISDIKHQDAKAARTAGDATFQKAHSQAELVSLFTDAHTYVKSTPTVVRKTVFRTRTSTAVANIYYFGGQTPYFIRITVSYEDNAWRLIGITGNSSEKPLLTDN